MKRTKTTISHKSLILIKQVLSILIFHTYASIRKPSFILCQVWLGLCTIFTWINNIILFTFKLIQSFNLQPDILKFYTTFMSCHIENKRGLSIRQNAFGIKAFEIKWGWFGFFFFGGFCFQLEYIMSLGFRKFSHCKGKTTSSTLLYCHFFTVMISHFILNLF